MKRLLAVSLTLNLVLVILLGIAYLHLGGMSLPKSPPDFQAIRSSLSTHLTEPDYVAVLKLDSFQSKQWLCQVKLVYQVKDFQASHWKELESLVRSVSRECSVPGRVAGLYTDPADPSHIIGATIEFGYSREVGYRHANEFDRQAA